MGAIRLNAKYVEKPWGRIDLPEVFGAPRSSKIGEIWFEGPKGLHSPLLVKYIFTSEKLSIQVHPNDSQARDIGLPGGKPECWYVLDAESGSRLGIGTVTPLASEALRAASLSGEIENFMDWKPVKAGDFFYIEAGTIHAIGAGVTVIEVQQNEDVTYRLYDYGRPRELHLDDGVAVSKAAPYLLPDINVPLGSEHLLVDGESHPFALRMGCWRSGETISLPAGPTWFIPITGQGDIDGEAWQGSECWFLENGAMLTTTSDCHVLIATADPSYSE